ncbi:MAG: diguanylate cyclase [Candidatus Hydrothermae bacterium]|nr:diguanylate cyclase [Candidatus Hydrothermae bacterium]HOK22464.1 diguanylate cyclase [Candidatus Hydrothermia bacterium]HOL23171.1 diguanylate cyclase [Candidatus Hydrothermia bacterium]HPO78181.1 diguanylate cyclase [Candidatus Hydrothermia bacterium]
MMESKIDYYADELTGAKNRRFLGYFTEIEVRRALRYKTNFSIILLDIDNFKEINDIYGHLEGDKVLKELADYITRNLRESDVLIRYGGDEFIIFLPNTSFENAKAVAEKILTGLMSEKVAGHSISLSMGVAEFPRDGKSWTELFNKADVALYRAKRRGKGRIAWVEEIEAIPVIPTLQFVDRVQEKKWILDSIKQGYKYVIVRGGAGIGKTRLVRDTLRKIDNAILVVGSAYGALADVPFSLLKDVIRYCYTNFKIELRETLSSLDPFELKAFSSVLPEMASSPYVKGIDKYKLYDTILKVFSYMALKNKMIVFIDDIQWADRSSFELLYYVIRNAPENLRFYSTLRVENSTRDFIEAFMAQALRERFVAILDLGPFDFSAATEFISAILQEETDEKVLQFLYSKSGGNPFFIEELIKELYERGNLLYNGKKWILTETESITVPQSIQHIMKKLIAEVEGDKVLEVASCIGHEFSPVIIKGVLGMDLGEIYDSIEKALKKGILVEAGQDNFVFKEDIMRELILQGVSQSKKRFYHQKIASWIEENKNQVANAEELIAQHAYLGGDREKIIGYAPIVAHKAMEQFAYEEAKRFWEYYFENEQDRERYVKEALSYVECLMIKGDLNEASVFLAEVEKEFNDFVDSEFYAKYSDVEVERGMFNEALRLINKAIEMAGVSDLHEEAAEIAPEGVFEKENEVPLYRFYVQKGWILIKLGKYEDARVILEQALVNKRYLSIYWEGTLYNVLGVLHAEISAPEEAISYYEKAIEIRRSIGDNKGLASSFVDIAVVYQDLVDVEKTIDYYEKARQIYQEIGYKGGLITVYIDISAYYLQMRRYDEAMSNIQKAYHEAYQIGSKDSMCIALNNMGSIFRIKCQWKQAEDLYNRALEIAEEIDSFEHKLMVYRNFVRVYTFGYHDLETAEKYHKKFVDLAKDREVDSAVIYSYLVGAQMYLVKDALEEVGKILDFITPYINQKRFSKFRDYYLEVKALYYFKRGENRKGGLCLAEVYENARELGVKDPDYIVSYFEWLFYIFVNTRRKSAAGKILNTLVNLYKKYNFNEDLELVPYLVKEVERIQ